MRLVLVLLSMLVAAPSYAAFDINHVDHDCDTIDVRDLRISCQAAIDHDVNLCSHISNDYDRDYCIKVVKEK